MIEKLILIAVFALIACASASAANDARVAGTVRDEKGKAIREAAVYLAKGDKCLTAQADRKGQFEFDGIAPGTYDYLAASLPPDDDPRRQRFPYLFARKALEVKAGETLQADVRFAPPQLPSPAALVVDAPNQLDGPDGRTRTKFTDVSIANPFSWHWERQRVGFRLNVEAGFAPNSVLVYDPEAKAIVPSQVSDAMAMEPGVSDDVLATSAVVHFLAEVQPNSRPGWRIFHDTGEFKQSWPGLRALLVSAHRVVLGTGKVSARLIAPLHDGIKAFKGKPASEAPAPLLAVCATDDAWIGAGRLNITDTIDDIITELLERGPIFTEYRVSYKFTSGSFYRVTFRFEAEAPFFTVKEESDGQYGIEPGSGGAFEFSAYPGLQPDQGYGIHWGMQEKKPAYDADATLVRIGNYMHIMSFGYTAASSRDEAKNALAVFSVNRGAWIDRRYAVDTWFPLRADPDGHMRVPWVTHYGSPHSAIGVEQRAAKPDLFFRFPLHDGTREWGLAVYPKELNVQPTPIGPITNQPGSWVRYLHVRAGDLPLDKFKDYVLEWQPKASARPLLNYGPDALPRIRRNLQDATFAALWQHERSAAFKAFASSDPRIAWNDRQRFLNDVEGWALATIRGHDLGHVPYNQVSVRGLVDLCETYDLLEASGVYDASELARLRAALAVLGYRFNDPNFMPPQFNQGQQDFDAARFAGVGAVGFTLVDHPHAATWAADAVQRYHDTLFIWQLAGGKWPENTPCYYQQSFCNYVYLAHQAARAGRPDVLASPDFQQFVNWTLLSITPPHPSDPDILRNGLGGRAYSSVVRTRHLPGVGDHGGPGGVEIKYDAALIAKDLQPVAPRLAQEMMWAFNAGGLPALMNRNAPPVNTTQMVPPRLLIACLEPGDLKAERVPSLDSRLLRGFGVILRDEFNKPDESFVLFRCGSTGVRYANSDNVLHYTSRGVPLLIDGLDYRENSSVLRENGGRFGPGRIARFASNRFFDYVLGESPAAKPEVRRRILFAKSDGFHVKGDYVVVSDESLIDDPVVSRIVVLADAVEQRGARPEVLCDALFTGRLGTDLEVFLAGESSGYERQAGDPLMKQEGRSEADGIRQKKFEVKLPKQGDCRMLLLPRHRPSSHPPLVSAFGPGFRVQRNERSNDIIFAGKPSVFRGEGVRFTGAAGAILRRDGDLHLFLLEGESIEADGISLASTTAPVSLCRFQNGDISVEAEGPGTIYVGFPFKRWVGLRMGAKETEVGAAPASKYAPAQMPTRIIDGRVMLLMDRGHHQFALRPH